jgi:hypothetical protein
MSNKLAGRCVSEELTIFDNEVHFDFAKGFSRSALTQEGEMSVSNHSLLCALIFRPCCNWSVAPILDCFAPKPEMIRVGIHVR